MFVLNILHAQTYTKSIDRLNNYNTVHYTLIAIYQSIRDFCLILRHVKTIYSLAICARCYLVLSTASLFCFLRYFIDIVRANSKPNMSSSSQPIETCFSKSYNSYAIPRTSDFTDFEIKCGGESWKVHKVIVCTRSSVLKSAITHEWKVWQLCWSFTYTNSQHCW